MRKFKIDNINKTVNLTFVHDGRIIADVKKCDRNTRWNPELKEWIIPVNDWSRTRIVYLMKKWDFKQYKEEYEDVDVDYGMKDIDLAYIKGLTDSKDFLYTPRDYQLEALGYCLDKGNVIIGDDVGLGKTFEAILYAEVTNSFPCLVIVPASVKYNWEEKWYEITKKRRRIAVIETKETKKRKNDWDADVIVINYDIIGKKQGRGATVRFEELMREWKMLIFDEAHFLKKSTSIRSKAAKKISNKSEVITMLSGTVTMNKPVELWNLLKIAKLDDLISDSYKQFTLRYCGAYKGHFGWNVKGATKTLELNRLLRENCYIRREKRDVLTELPEVTKQVLRVPISNTKAYEAANEDFIQYLIDTEGNEKAEKAEEAVDLVMLAHMRKMTIEGKLKSIEQYLNDWKESDEKLLIFGLHREPLNYLSEKYKSDLIAGGVSSKKKQEIVKSFAKNDDQFLFANMISAGTGIDGLQETCSNMLIIELPWRPSDLTQAIGRLDRSGQTIPVTVTFALCDKTIDWDMWKMLEHKEIMTEAVNKGIDVQNQESGMKDVMKRLIKNKK